MQTNCTKSEIETRARERFGYPASVHEFVVRYDGVAEPWWMLQITIGTGAKQIIGCRRSLDEMPKLIRRGPVMGHLSAPDGRRAASTVVDM